MTFVCLLGSLRKTMGALGKNFLNHIELMINVIVVDLHSTPAILNNSLYNHRLQKWLNRNADLQCSNIVAFLKSVLSKRLTSGVLSIEKCLESEEPHKSIA